MTDVCCVFLPRHSHPHQLPARSQTVVHVRYLQSQEWHSVVVELRYQARRLRESRLPRTSVCVLVSQRKMNPA